VHTAHHSPTNPPKSMAKACPALATAVMLVARAASGTGDGSVGVTKSEVFSGRGVLVPTSHTTAMQVQVVPVVRESSHQSTANHRVADERSWPHSPPTNWSTVPTFYFATVKATTDATSGGVVIPPETLAFLRQFDLVIMPKIQASHSFRGRGWRVLVQTLV
jgi:hypothetical protein